MLKKHFFLDFKMDKKGIFYIICTHMIFWFPGMLFFMNRYFPSIKITISHTPLFNLLLHNLNRTLTLSFPSNAHHLRHNLFFPFHNHSTTSSNITPSFTLITHDIPLPPPNTLRHSARTTRSLRYLNNYHYNLIKNYL